MNTRRAKILIIGYHDCLVTRFSKDKVMHFSPALLEYAAKMQYDFFIGFIDANCMTVGQMHTQRKFEYLEQEQKHEPKLSLKNFARIAKHKNEKFDEENLYLDRITAKFSVQTQIKFMTVSSFEDVSSLLPLEKKCGYMYPELVQAEKDHEYEVSFDREFEKRTRRDLILLQLLQIIELLKKELRSSFIEIDFINTGKNCEDALALDSKLLPDNFIFNVFKHQHVDNLSQEILKMATITSKRVEKSFKQVSELKASEKKQVTKFFSLADGVAPPPDPSSSYFSLKDKEEDESCCFCLPTWCRKS